MSDVSIGDIWPYLLLASFLAMVAWNCRGLLKRGNAADESAK